MKEGKQMSEVVYNIVGEYRGNQEILDEAETDYDAEYLVAEYSMAFGSEWAIWKEVA